MKETFYITGHEGFIGTALLKRWGCRAIPWTPDLPTGKAIIHLASRVGVAENSKRELADVQFEMDMHRQVFDWVRQTKTPLFLASSSEVYGSSHAPMKESDPLLLHPPGNPRWMYARIKAFNEQFALQLGAETGVKVVIGRFFNVCGPGQNPASGMVLPNLIFQALNNLPLTIFGDGSVIRTFTHIDDVCEAIEHLMVTDSISDQVVNIGSENVTTISNLAHEIIRITGSNSKIVYQPSPFSDLQIRRPAITLLRELMGVWEPRGLGEIIADTADWLRGKTA